MSKVIYARKKESLESTEDTGKWVRENNIKKIQSYEYYQGNWDGNHFTPLNIHIAIS